MALAWRKQISQRTPNRSGMSSLKEILDFDICRIVIASSTLISSNFSVLVPCLRIFQFFQVYRPLETCIVVIPQVTDGCIVGAMCKLTTKETLSENTVIYGKECHRRHAPERPTPQILQLDFLTKILPNYHVIKGRNK